MAVFHDVGNQAGGRLRNTRWCHVCVNCECVSRVCHVWMYVCSYVHTECHAKKRILYFDLGLKDEEVVKV